LGDLRGGGGNYDDDVSYDEYDSEEEDSEEERMSRREDRNGKTKYDHSMIDPSRPRPRPSPRPGYNPNNPQSGAKTLIIGAIIIIE